MQGPDGDKQQEAVDGLTARLRQLARDRPMLDVAQFQFVGLDEVRRAYGDQWPVQRDRIRSIAHDYLKRRIHAADVLVKGGDGFVIVFGSAQGREAEIAALGLTHGLNEFFLGEVREFPTPRLGVNTIAVPIKDLVETLGQLEYQTGDNEPAFDPDPVDVKWLFQPVWDVKREALTQHWQIGALSASNQRLPGYSFETQPGKPPKLARVDTAAVGEAVQSIRRLLADGKRAIIGAQVHVSSLINTGSRKQILNTIDQMEVGLLRFMALRVSGVAPGFPRVYLEEIIGPLKIRGMGVVLGVSWDEPDLHSLVKMDIAAVSLAFPSTVLGPNAVAPQSMLLAKVRKAIEVARQSKKLLNVEGAIPHDLAIRLSAAGTDLIASPTVWPPSPAPKSVASWPADRLARHGELQAAVRSAGAAVELRHGKVG